jgi:hypothetical protein
LAIWSYRCPAGHETEVIDITNKSRVPSIPCTTCGATAVRVLAPVAWRWGTRKESAISAAIGRARKVKPDP